MRVYVFDVEKIDTNIRGLNYELVKKKEDYRWVRWDIYTIPVDIPTYDNWDKFKKSQKKTLLRKWQKLQNKANANKVKQIET